MFNSVLWYEVLAAGLPPIESSFFGRYLGSASDVFCFVIPSVKEASWLFAA